MTTKIQPGRAFANTLKTFTTASGKAGQFYSLPALAKTFPNVSRLPVSIRDARRHGCANNERGEKSPS